MTRTTLAFSIAFALHVALLQWAPGAHALEHGKPVEMVVRQAPPKPVEPPKPLPPVARKVRKSAAPSQPVEPVLAAAVTAESDSAPALAVADAPVTQAAVVAPEVPVAPAAPEGKGAGVDAGAFDSYRGALHGRVASLKRYPIQARRMHIEGVTTVVFRVKRDGQLACAPQVVTSSHPLLDAEAVRMVQSAAPFPPLPRGTDDEEEFKISINFSLSS